MDKKETARSLTTAERMDKKYLRVKSYHYHPSLSNPNQSKLRD
jgi:hypothetical protein